MQILVTGGAGFIGSHLTGQLLAEGHRVVCFDNFNEYYAPESKRGNIAAYLQNAAYTLVEGDIRDAETVQAVMAKHSPGLVVHLAAQAGVRPSLADPAGYFATNVSGTLHVLDAMRAHGCKKMVFASSSSVYGLNSKVPFAETDPTLRPASPYAASKIAGEALCHTYANLYDLEIVALRLFTVYGPRQRPDLAIRKFMERILRGEEIVLYGDGSSARDYTFVSDIVAGFRAAMDYAPAGGYEVFNLGNSSPVKLQALVAAIENSMGVTANKRHIGDQSGDVPITFADISKSRDKLGYDPKTPLDEGLPVMLAWLREHFTHEKI